MSYKVGEIVSCLVVNHLGKKKFFLDDRPSNLPIEKMSFEIISINKISQTCPEKLYMLLIPDEMPGWVVSQWRIDRQNVDSKFLNKKFYEVGEYYLNREILRVEPEKILEDQPSTGD